jgi:hypothetical protein
MAWRNFPAEINDENRKDECVSGDPKTKIRRPSCRHPDAKGKSKFTVSIIPAILLYTLRIQFKLFPFPPSLLFLFVLIRRR